MENVYGILQERGYLEQETHSEEIKDLLEKEKVTFYIGFDATAESLHVGHLLQIMVMKHMQKAGHRPIVLLGGGTTMVGDPTGKTDMRKMLTPEEIDKNAKMFKSYFEKYIDFSDGKALVLNNADWLLDLNYVGLLREIGVHFSVNRMLAAECYKSRLDKGLSFLEFNYMIMQSYDFLHLYKNYDCKMQFGGNDQWSNIIGGVELIRKKERGSAFGVTFTLLTTSEGKKMGKTEKGALWLDPQLTTPYEFYQYWRNIEDADVKKSLYLMTFLPKDEVERLGNLEGSKINKAKEILAYEVTKIVHGEKEALRAMNAAKALFDRGRSDKNIPHSNMERSYFKEPILLIDLLEEVDLVQSKSEARRLIKQNGISVNDKKVKELYKEITLDDFVENKLLLQRGKKKYLEIRI
ncbi:MAG: tyrosine--tRNA ligase [Clostridia bacterium]